MLSIAKHLPIILLGLFSFIFPAKFTPPRHQACLETSGRIEISSLKSPSLKLPMEFRVYLPPCYDEEPGRRYPVLYLVHGQNYNDDQWDRLGADEIADRLIASGEIPPFLIVMPRDRNWDQPSIDPFGKVVVDELIPLIDERYRTLPGSQYRAIGGLSRGAAWAIHLGLSNWQLFGAIGGHSPPVFWSDTSKIRTWLKEIPSESFPRIYMDIGDKDRPPILASAIWFENLLTQLGIPHEWHLFPGYHEEAYWHKNLPRYLRWYAVGW
jgi:enterochelin esterase-like enzyme